MPQNTEDIIDAEIIDEQEGTEPQLRQVIIVAHPLASPFALQDTLEDIIVRQQIERAVIDPSTRAGIAAGYALIAQGVPYLIADLLTETDRDLAPELDELEQEDSLFIIADSENPEEILTGDDIPLQESSPILIPRHSRASNKDEIELSPGSLVGLTFALVRQAESECLLIQPPEFGLIPVHGNLTDNYVLRSFILRDE